MVEQYQQVIFCSERESRAFLREVSIAPNNACVTSVEKLPPHYEIPIEKMRAPDEKILKMDTAIEGYTGCPFCANRGLFYCDECGKISCCKGGDTHYCPGCRKIHGTMDSKYNYLSKSGLLYAAPEPLRVDNTAPVKRRDYTAAPPNPEKIEKLEVVRKFLEEKRKLRIEDKR